MNKKSIDYSKKKKESFNFQTVLEEEDLSFKPSSGPIVNETFIKSKNMIYIVSA